jgi:type II secretory pathway pseudopilin PulG
VLEVVVAVLILGLALAGLGPQIVGAVRATGKAKLVSQAKGVLQGQLDGMRTLPFRVAPAAGDHRDLLDTYYRNLVAPTTAPVCATAAGAAQPSPAWTGYVSATSSARCAYEPAGAFYRTVIPGGTASLPPWFVLVLGTQFVSGSIPPTVRTPPAGYDTQVAGRDRAPAQQVGVTATVLYRHRGSWQPVTVYTQIAALNPTDPRIRLAANATVVQIGSTATDGIETLALTGGQLSLTGSLFNTSQAHAGLSAVAGVSSVTGRTAGASLAQYGPYASATGLDAPAGGLAPDCSGICWGASAISPFEVSADDGLVRAGVGPPGSVAPVRTLLPDNATRDGFRFRAGGVTLPGLSEQLVSMDSTPPPGTVLTGQVAALSGCAFPAGEASSPLSAAGYLDSTVEGPAMSVEACAGGHTEVIRVLPTVLAPDGLVRITARSSARCRVTDAAHTPSVTTDYRAEVEYWSWDPAAGTGRYLSAGVITPASSSDPLASVPLASTFVDATRVLGDYIDSWTGLRPGRVQPTTTAGVAAVSVPPLVTLQTKPVRNTDPASAVSVAVASVSCYAEDAR